MLITRLLLVLEVWDGKPTYRKSWVKNVLKWANFTLGFSFKVKRCFNGVGELCFWWIQFASVLQCDRSSFLFVAKKDKSKCQISSKVLKLCKSFQICHSSSFFQTCCTFNSCVIATLKFLLLSKSIVNPKLFQLQYFLKIYCSTTLSLTTRWYIVQGSIACHR